LCMVLNARYPVILCEGGTRGGRLCGASVAVLLQETALPPAGPRTNGRPSTPRKSGSPVISTTINAPRPKNPKPNREPRAAGQWSRDLEIPLEISRAVEPSRSRTILKQKNIVQIQPFALDAKPKRGRGAKRYGDGLTIARKPTDVRARSRVAVIRVGGGPSRGRRIRAEMFVG